MSKLKDTRGLAHDLFWSKQLSLPLFSTSPISMMEPAKVKSAGPKRTSAKKLFLARQMALPLLPLPEGICRKATLSDLDADPNVWSEEQRIMAHGILLWESIYALSLPGNAAEKVDVLCWIFTDEDNRYKQYSFDVCCDMYGYNAYRIRSLIEDQLAELKKGVEREKLGALMDQLQGARQSLSRLGAMKLAG